MKRPLKTPPSSALAIAAVALLAVNCTSMLGVDGEYVTGDENEVTPVTTGGNSSDTGDGSASSDSGGFGGSTGAGTGRGTDSGGCANRALSFDGDENVVWVDDDPSLDPAGAISVEAWLEPSAAGLNDNEPQYIVGHISIYGLQGYLLYLDESGRVVFGHFGQGGWEDTEGQQKLAADSWYHVAGSFDGATLRVFVNGALSGETAGDITSTSNCDCPLTIGSNQSADKERAFDGAIDEVRISSSAYTTSFSAPTEALAVERDTVALWRFDESSGAALVDEAGLQNAHLGNNNGSDGEPQRFDAPCIADFLH